MWTKFVKDKLNQPAKFNRLSITCKVKGKCRSAWECTCTYKCHETVQRCTSSTKGQLKRYTLVIIFNTFLCREIPKIWYQWKACSTVYRAGVTYFVFKTMLFEKFSLKVRSFTYLACHRCSPANCLWLQIYVYPQISRAGSLYPTLQIIVYFYGWNILNSWHKIDTKQIVSFP